MISGSTSKTFAGTREIFVTVNGIVCGFCAHGIERNLSGKPGVEKVAVSLSDKKVVLTMKDGQDLTDDLIKKVLLDSGYNVEKVERK